LYETVISGWKVQKHITTTWSHSDQSGLKGSCTVKYKANAKTITLLLSWIESF